MNKNKKLIIRCSTFFSESDEHNKNITTRQHRKALWHNGCPSHNLLRHLTFTHDLDNKRGEGITRKNEKHKNNLTQRTKNEI